VLRLYCKLFGWPPPHVTYYIIHHDTGEYITGDIPFHAKKMGGQPFRNQIDVVEKRGMQEQLPRVCEELERAFRQMHAIELWRAKACDLLDMVEFSLMEMRLGNNMFQVVVERVELAITSHITGSMAALPEDDIRAVRFYTDELVGAQR
jgi:5'-deoxynucleotidase YfbR-like HD superfamily hydrolase